MTAVSSNKHLLSLFSFILIIVVTFLLLYANHSLTTENPGKITPSSTTLPVPTSINTSSLPSSTYPNNEMTPGDTFNAASKEVVCQSSYTATVRDVPVSLKRKVYNEYGLSYPQPSGAYEVDHFIPLALGGSNDIKNLWPQPAEPRPGYREKDVVEVFLRQQVCEGKVTLKQAQEDIKNDWYKVYISIPRDFEKWYEETFDEPNP